MQEVVSMPLVGLLSFLLKLKLILSAMKIVCQCP